jgi:hypothetical protein
MRFAVNLITTATFLLHFALGCCAHHAHAADEASLLACTAHDNHDHSGHRHDQPASHDESTDDSQCPSEHCDDGHCVFVLCGKTVLVKAIFIAVLPPLDADLTSHTTLCSQTIAKAIASAESIAPPLRAHLLNQVLLI